MINVNNNFVLDSFHLINCDEELVDKITKIRINIFSNLSKSDLKQCARVCSGWQVPLEEVWYSILKKEHGSDALAACGPFIAQMQLSWKQAYYLFPLIHFLVQTADREESNNVYAADYRFSITDEGDITCLTKENCEEMASFPCSQKPVALAVDKEFLFVLQENGEIIQWNWRTFDHTKIISTHFSTGNFYLEGHTIDKPYFSVHDDLIILHYFQTPIIEVIDTKTNKSQVFEDEKFTYVSNFLKKGRHLWFKGAIDPLNERILHLDLSRGELVSDFVIDSAVTIYSLYSFKDSIYFCGEFVKEDEEEEDSTEEDPSLCVYKLEKNQLSVEKHILFSENYTFNYFLVINKLLFGVESLFGNKPNQRYSRIVVIDLELESVVKIFERLCFTNHNIDPSIASQLFDYVKNSSY